MGIIKKIAEELGINKEQINKTILLLNDGNTIPFIARYRKEITGGLDEVQILNIREKYDYITRLENRKIEVIEKIKDKEKLNKELEKKIMGSTKLKEVEDLYRPYMDKKNTLAQKAREKGLDILAEKIIKLPKELDLEKYIEDELKNNKNVTSKDEVIDGIKELVKEHIVEDVEIREEIRKEYSEKSFIVSKLKDIDKDKKGTYEPYYNYKEEVNKIPSHRLLAMKRGENEGILKLSFDVEKEIVLKKIKNKFVGDKKTSVEELVNEIIKESYSKSLKGSIEREINSELKESSDNRAIEVFKQNLESLLMQAPIKGKTVLGFDPAYRTGCKLAVVDGNGKYLDKLVIYPHPPINKKEESIKKLKEVIKKYSVNLIAIGNGTASRESEEFVANLIKELDVKVEYIIVNEAGASVYSASENAREEFPEFSVEERSAVSIARRVIDPLAELVKIDPKSIGIGQYQHDVDQKELQKALDFTIEKIVNRVGVNLNTASVELLSYISGLNKKIAFNIVEHRKEKGYFTSRYQLKKIKGLGPKAYEQSVGFLRIYDGDEKLDETGIHPENYKVAKNLLKALNINENELGKESISNHVSKIRNMLNEKDINLLEKIDKSISIELVKDILMELEKPRRDIRSELSRVLLRSDVLTIEDVEEGMQLIGTVRNVVDFGVFVDVGLKNDGLVHISKMSNKFIKHPSEVVQVGDIINVWVDNVEVDKGKVSLRMI